MAQIKLRSLATVTADEARSYLETARGDAIVAAIAIAIDRNALAGTDDPPDDQDVHHSLFLIHKALGMSAPSFDDTRAALRAHRGEAAA